MDKITGIKNNHYIAMHGVKQINNNVTPSIVLYNFAEKNGDGFTYTKKSDIRHEYEIIKKQQGFIGKTWNGIKNFFGMKSGSDYVEKIIEQAEKGQISEQEAKEVLANYKEGQSICVDIVADIASGILAVGAFALAIPTGGASIIPALSLATALGAGTKVGIKASDALLNNKEYNSKNLLYDCATGAVNGLLAPITNGIGNTVTKTIGKKLGLQVIQKSTSEIAEQGIKQTAKNVILNQTIDVTGKSIGTRALALGTGMAVDGAIGGASDNMVRASLNGENIFRAGVQGAIGGMFMAPIIGGGFRIAGKVGSSIADNTSIKSTQIDTSSIKTQDNIVNTSAIIDSADNISDVIKPKTNVDHDAAVRAASRVTDDAELQSALVRMAENEGIIIRTKEDAIPILQRQYQSLDDTNNVFVLDINPQPNNGMPKSNNLISKWFIEANGLSEEQLITLTSRDFNPSNVQAKDLCPEWKQGNPIHTKLQKLSQKLTQNPQKNPMSLQNARKIIEDCHNLTPDNILAKYSENELAQAIAKINSTTIIPFTKKGGYAGALAEQINEAIAKSNGEKITFVIPDDCSLSGSSILCDTVKIMDIVNKNGNLNSKIDIVFSPMILGDEAQKVIRQFNDPNFALNDTYLRKISAIRSDGKESFKDAINAFNRVKNSDNINIKLSDESIKAVHFTETETFKQIGIENPLLQQRLLYLMQGPMEGNNALFGGFGQCGVMVVTPTDAFTVNGVKYAGKIPTNSVGFMEILGQESGVINDALEKDVKGLFTKGTGLGYQRYCEWDGLSKPSNISDRIPIFVLNGNVNYRSAS